MIVRHLLTASALVFAMASTATAEIQQAKPAGHAPSPRSNRLKSRSA